MSDEQHEAWDLVLEDLFDPFYNGVLSPDQFISAAQARGVDPKYAADYLTDSLQDN